MSTPQFLSQHIEQLHHEIAHEKTELMQKTSALKAAQVKEKSLETSLTTKRQVFKTKENEMKRLQSSLTQIKPGSSDQHIKKIEGEIKNDKASIAKFEVEIKKNEEKIVGLENNIKKDEAELTSTTSHKSAQEQSQLQQKEQTDHAQVEMRALTTEITQLETELDSIRRTNKIMEDTITTLEKASREKTAEVARAENEQKEAIRSSNLKNRV